MNAERDDERLLRHIAEHYAPAPMSPARRVAFREGLRRRIERRRRVRRMVPALASAAAAGGFAWLLVAAPGSPPAPPDGAQVASAPVEIWEYELFYRDAASRSEGSDEALLPDDYVAIASAFLER